MITGFEDYTFEVTDQEKKNILPKLLILLASAKGKQGVITNEQLVRTINECPGLQAAGIKTNTPRIRKMIHEIRVSDRIPLLIATSEGYYVSQDRDEVDKYLDSLRERINSITEVYMALKRQQFYIGNPAPKSPEKTPSLF